MGKIQAPGKTLKELSSSSLKLKGLQIQAEFMALGFRSMPEFTAIVTFYYPEIEIIQLYKYWNNVQHSTALHNKLEAIIETLKFI